MLRCFRTFAALLALASTAPAVAVDESDLLPVDEAFAVQATAPSANRIQFDITIADGYYLYRHRTSAKVLDADIRTGALDLPHGTPKHDEFFGDVETWRNAVTMALPGVEAAGATQAQVELRYQGCADIGICYPPQKRVITVALPALAASSLVSVSGLPVAAPLAGLSIGTPTASAVVDEGLPLPEDEAFKFEAIAVSPVEVLMRFTPAPGYYLYQDRNQFRLLDAKGATLAAPQWPKGKAHTDEHFGNVIVYFDQIEVPLGLRRTDGKAGPVTLEATFQGCQNNGICYPPMTRQVQISLPAASADQLVSVAEAASFEARRSGDSTPFVLILLAALGGGLILNLMPCVLPVLSLKALGLAQSGESPAKARAHALWYTAGVLVSFAALGGLALALRQAGLALGWGFQLQQPWVVAALAYLMAAVGFSLSGVFSIGAGWAGAGQGLASRSGASGDFFTGVLAVVVASPCTAPFMGSALAFAFGAPTVLAIAVFLALGLGLALPFLLIGFVPALARVLPKPGAWMETFKQVLAFPMYLTAIWLLWVLGQQRGVDAMAYALAGIAVLALALWRWEKARLGGVLARVVAVALVLLALIPLWRIPSLAKPASAEAASANGSIAYSAERLDALRAEGRTVFVNMTADWCVTCKANEKRVLDTDDFRALLKQHDAVYMKGDWTNVDPAITAFLEKHHAVGVPLYVVIQPQRDDAVLPTVLTLGAVENALGPPL
ncbi:MAG TPA: protein-disulfide reductase DsbD [Chiayiivirga sp.]|nr:protein-disulfide reductase DsbD [Chiayiivirga sp.]